MLSETRFTPRRIHVAFIVIAAFAFYARTLDTYWFKDDLGIAVLTDGHDVAWSSFFSFLWPSHMESEQFWRPIPMLLGFIDYSFWGVNPIGYHVVNTLLHSLVGVLVYYLANRLTGFANPTLGFIAGLAVVLDPINGEAVVWVLQRMVLLGASFSLAAMLAWLKAVESGRTRWRIVGLFLLACGILCKETTVTLPGCFFLVDLFWAAKGTAFRSRLRTALRWAVPCAVILAVYLSCRLAMWGRIDLKYAGLEPQEYAEHNQVFERMPTTLASCFVPVNAGVFHGVWREIIQGAVLAAYGLAVARGVLLLVQRPVYRKLLALMVAFLAFSLVPILWIFWVDERLFNGRFFYQPAIATLVVTAAGLWLPRRDHALPAGPHALASMLVPYVGSALLVLAFAASLAGGLTAFEEAGFQVRGIQTSIERYAERQRESGVEPVLAVLDTPSQVKGVPTFETSLRLALQPPLSEPGVDCIPLLSGFASDWPKIIEDHVRSRGLDPARLRYVTCTYDPPAVRPLFGAPEPAVGPLPVELTAPPDHAFRRNDAGEPEFGFTAPAGTSRFVLVLASRDKPEPIRIQLVPGKNADRTADGHVRYRLSRGDGVADDFPDLWKTVIQKPQPHPVPVAWRVESYDDAGQLVGVSADRRLVVFDVLSRR